MPVEMSFATPALVAMAFASSVALTAVARRIAGPLGLLDRPDGRRKVHAGPTPVMGGVALFTALCATLAAAMWLAPADSAAGTLRWSLLVPLLASAALACLLGAWDDRHPLRARTKLLLQIAASVPFACCSRSIESIHLLGWELELGLAGYAFTAFWLVACANVINLIDGLDGLAGTVGLIITASIAGLAAMKGVTPVATVALIFAACLLGFLVHNWPPARIFLGDSGSLQIGFVVGALSIEASLKKTTGFALAVPLVLLSVPVFDTAMAITRRVLTGRGIGEGDRLHIHHRLQARGFSRAQSLLAISGLCTTMAVVTLLSARYDSDVVALGMCSLLLVLLIYGRVFGYDETLLFLRGLRETAAAVATYAARGDLRRVLRTLSANEGDWDTAWAGLTPQFERLGVRRLQLTAHAPPADNTPATHTWESAAPEAGSHEWRMTLRVSRDAGTVTLEASGTTGTRDGAVPLDVVRLLLATCRAWPAALARGDEIRGTSVIPLRPPEEVESRLRRVA